MTFAAQAAHTLSLRLVSHTAVGMTTLARTLRGRDWGKVRDQAHATTSVDAHPRAESAAGDRVLVGDTPGLGVSLRLACRLALTGKPLGGLMTGVWDRWRDRAFWANPHATRHVPDQAGVLLCPVNAAEAPKDGAYLAPELQVLALVDEPMIVPLIRLARPAWQRTRRGRCSAGKPIRRGQPGWPYPQAPLPQWANSPTQVPGHQPCAPHCRWMRLPAAGRRRGCCCRRLSGPWRTTPRRRWPG